MVRRAFLILLGAAAGVAVTVATTQPRLLLDGARAHAETGNGSRQLRLFGTVFERVRANYVEKPDDAKLIQSAINGMLTGLDPHSSYMDAKGFREMRVQSQGKFGGLGIEVTIEDGRIKVVAPIDETPAAKAGIMANDIITHVDEESMQGLTLDQAVDKIRGPVNTNIKLNITRKGQEKPIQVSVTREIIRVRSVRSHLEGGDVGFVRITQFNELTADGLKKAIADLTTQSRDKLRGFIIDLRHRSVGISRGKVLSRPARNPISLRTQRTIEPFVLRSI
jgi:carboxyl-terminal processing protease